MTDELELAWKELEEEIEEQTKTNKEEIMAAITQESKSPLSKLKQATKMRLNWTLFFTIICLIGMVGSYQYPRAVLLWGFGFAYYFWGLLSIRHYLKKLDEHFDHNIKSVLENYYHRLTKMLSVEERISTFVIPFSVVLGFTLSGVYDGETFAQIFDNGKKVAFLLAVTILFSAFSFWYIKKLNYIAYGKYLEKLKTNLDLLNTIQK